jgi:uncharacterized membrane protein
MPLYPIALFLHIVGALGLFMALALEWTSLLYLRRAVTIEQVREWLGIANRLGWVYAPSFLVILVSGFYMTAIAWSEGGAAWIAIGLLSLVVLGVLGMAVSGRKMKRITKAAATEDDLVSPDLRQRLRDPLLWTSVQTRAAIALGVVFLMTVKPDLTGALVAIGATSLLGIASALPARRRQQPSAVAA